MEKRELRKYIRARKREYSAETLGNMSHTACQHLLDNSLLAKAKTVMMYYPLSDEVDITSVIEQYADRGKTVLLPQVTGDTTMVLRRYTGRKDLREGAFGIMEPCGELFTDYKDIDVAVIPGMAFDSECNRLGRGKGYYDRFLPLLPDDIYIIGICFPFQLLQHIPTEAHDWKADCVVC